MHEAYILEMIDILYVSRKEGRRGVPNFQDSVDASTQRIEDNIKKSLERLILATKNNTKIKWTLTRKRKCQENQIHGYFKRQTSEIS